jgi:hypothetical protein
MTKPIIKQVNKHGVVHWEVTHQGMTRFFLHDWKAKWHYESLLRYHRSRSAPRDTSNDVTYGLPEQFGLMPALLSHGNTQTHQCFLVIAAFDLSNCSL